MVSHLLDEFYLLIQKVVFQQVTEVRVCAGRIQETQVQEPDSGSSPGPRQLPWPPEFYPTHLEMAAAHPGEVHPAIILHLELVPSPFSSANGRSGLHPPDLCHPDQNSSPERDRCRGPMGTS